MILRLCIYGLVFLMYGALGKAMGDELPSVHRIENWEEAFNNGDWQARYGLVDSLYKLPHQPWPEPLRELLLKIAEWDMTRIDSMRNAYDANGNLKYQVEGFSHDSRETFAGNLKKLVVSQEDKRFVPFLAGRLGGGMLTVRGLAAIGEPAFDSLIAASYRDGWSSQADAARALGLILAKRQNFLERNEQKRETAKRALLHVVRAPEHNHRIRAINALVYIPDAEVTALLDSLSQYDNYEDRKGRYRVREKAQEALQRLRGNR